MRSQIIDVPEVQRIWLKLLTIDTEGHVVHRMYLSI